MKEAKERGMNGLEGHPVTCSTDRPYRELRRDEGRTCKSQDCVTEDYLYERE